MDSLKAIILGASVVGAQSFSSSRLSNVTTSAGIAYTTQVVTALTTYCPLATTLTYGNKTYTIKSATTLTITDCPCTIHKPVETGMPAGGPECAKKCNEEYNACRTAPDANMSFCASKLASCVGYNPFTGGSFMSPTACAAGAAATATGSAGSSGSAGDQGSDAECAKKCNEEYNACRFAPDANMSFCASKLASCVGYNPFTGGSFASPTACSAAATQPAGGAGGAGGQATGTGANPPAVTAGAGQITPALALLALGAVALL
ncbi:hypothetical protein E4U60_006667 [Claviceps pazoutovae]|uniref:Cell wall glycoprotein n=1 Tax=Claviceps pazoutovae TaxID=1649127 RepID=A0A9P7M6L7_9HYPO|nr:hypothetical protein E4U60_006667 [Claviceps pazoutovae]